MRSAAIEIADRSVSVNAAPNPKSAQVGKRDAIPSSEPTATPIPATTEVKTTTPVETQSVTPVENQKRDAVVTSNPGMSTATKAGIIVGAVVGSAALFAGVVGVGAAVKRRNANRHLDSDQEADLNQFGEQQSPFLAEGEERDIV